MYVSFSSKIEMGNIFLNNVLFVAISVYVLIIYLWFSLYTSIQENHISMGA